MSIERDTVLGEVWSLFSQNTVANSTRTRLLVTLTNDFAATEVSPRRYPGR